MSVRVLARATRDAIADAARVIVAAPRGVLLCERHSYEVEYARRSQIVLLHA